MKLSILNTVLLGIICFLALVTLLADISVNISWSASITDWLSVIIYFCALCAAITAALIAHNALNENKSIALDTKRMADDNAELVRQQTQPFIDIKLEIMPQSIHWIRLKITNIGLSSAINIHFRFEKILNNKEQATDKIIEKYKSIRFMTDGLNYLSKEEARYTNFINLIESDQERGFTVEEFLQTSFKVFISFQDLAKRKYENSFLLSMNELEGHYKIGETIEEKLVKKLEEINQSIKSFKNEHENFKKEYEKSHRDWTEEELRLKVRGLDLKRARYKSLGIPYPESTKPKRKNKLSIQQLRKQNK